MTQVKGGGGIMKGMTDTEKLDALEAAGYYARMFSGPRMPGSPGGTLYACPLFDNNTGTMVNNITGPESFCSTRSESVARAFEAVFGPDTAKSPSQPES